MNFPKRLKGLSVILAFLAVLTLIGVLLIGLQQEPQTMEYADVIACFQQNKVKEYSLDMGTGDLTITKMDGLAQGEHIRYRVPHVGNFIEDTTDYVNAYNEANPVEPISFEYKRPPDMPWWIPFLQRVY